MARMHVETAGRITAGRAVIAEVTDAQRIAAATDAGFSPEVAGMVFAGKLTFHRALTTGMRLGLIERPKTGAAREKGLLR